MPARSAAAPPSHAKNPFEVGLDPKSNAAALNRAGQSLRYRQMKKLNQLDLDWPFKVIPFPFVELGLLSEPDPKPAAATQFLTF